MRKIDYRMLWLMTLLFCLVVWNQAQARELNPADRKVLDDTRAGVLPDGSVGEDEIADDAVTSAKVKDGEIVDADCSSSMALSQSKVEVDGLGDVVAAIGTLAEAAGAYEVSTITFTNVSLTATDTSDEGESVKVFDADDGAFCLLMAITDCTVVNSAGATGDYYVAFGTAGAGDDADLTSTEADIIPKTTITGDGSVKTNAFDAVIADPTVFDGTGTAKDVYYNFAIADGNMNANVTNTLTGTLVLLSTKPRDH